MIEPQFSTDNEYFADNFNLLQDSVFAFDFSEQVLWVSDILATESKQRPIKIPKDSFSYHKISFCRNMPIFAYIDESETSAFVIDAQQGEMIREFKLQDSRIECVSINDSGDRILIGGKNGTLSRWEIFSGKLLNIPNKHKDFVLCAKESGDKRFVASVSYDKAVMLFDKRKDKTGMLVCYATATIRCMEFFDDNRFLALGDTDGFIYIINTDTRFLAHKFQATFAPISALAHYKNTYLFCLGGNGILGVVDYHTQEKILESFAPQNRYKSFIIRDEMIALATFERKILAYSFKAFLDYGQNMLDNDDILGVYNFIGENRFLQGEEFYLALETKYQADTLEAIALACSLRQDSALEILHKYVNIPAKRREVTNLMSEIHGIDEFLKLMESQLEIRAIPLASKNPLLRELKSYADFEVRFSRVLILAKELVKKNKKPDANTVMMQYKKIPSKIRAIQEVLSYPDKVDNAIEAIKNRDYKTFFRLKKDYHFVNFLQDAEILMRDGEGFYYQLLEAFYALDLQKCVEIIEILRNFSEYKDFVIDIEFKISEITSLIEKLQS